MFIWVSTGCIILHVCSWSTIQSLALSMLPTSPSINSSLNFDILSWCIFTVLTFYFIDFIFSVTYFNHRLTCVVLLVIWTFVQLYLIGLSRFFLFLSSNIVFNYLEIVGLFSWFVSMYVRKPQDLPISFPFLSSFWRKQVSFVLVDTSFRLLYIFLI